MSIPWWLLTALLIVFIVMRGALYLAERKEHKEQKEHSPTNPA